MKQPFRTSTKKILNVRKVYYIPKVLKIEYFTIIDYYRNITIDYLKGYPFIV